MPKVPVVKAAVPQWLRRNDRVLWNFRRRAALAPMVALLGVMIFSASGATAANTRVLYVGDPALVNSSQTGYVIHPTPVSAGQLSYFDVLIKNLGKQTLTGAEIAMGTLIATSDGSGNFGQALPTGWKITNILYVSGIKPTCTTDAPSAVPSSGLITPGAYDGFACEFGNLAKGGNGTIRVYLQAGPDLSQTLPTDIQVSGKVAENTGGNVGSNTNTFYAYGDGPFIVTGDGKVAGLFDKNSGPISPSIHGGVNTSVDLFALSSTSQFVVSIDETLGGFTCPTGFSCVNGASTVHVNQGASVSPYFVWVAQFPVAASYKLSTKSGFVHFFESYDPTSNPSAYEVFYAVNKTSCSKPIIPCADFTLVNGGTSNAYVQVYFKTPNNGSGKLF